MNKAIYKYDIDDKPWTGPKVVKILGVAFQHGTLRAWCEVDLDEPWHAHRWLLIPTGGNAIGIHAGSVGQLDGSYVWHIYCMQEYSLDDVPEEDGVDTDVILTGINQYDNILFQR